MKHSRKDYNRIQDPLNLIPADEPVFLLRGQDMNAIPTLIAYRESVLKNGGLSPETKELMDSIEQHINVIRQWQSTHGFKMPDLLPPIQAEQVLNSVPEQDEPRPLYDPNQTAQSEPESLEDLKSFVVGFYQKVAELDKAASVILKDISANLLNICDTAKDYQEKLFVKMTEKAERIQAITAGNTNPVTERNSIQDEGQQGEADKMYKNFEGQVLYENGETFKVSVSAESKEQATDMLKTLMPKRKKYTTTLEETRGYNPFKGVKVEKIKEADSSPKQDSKKNEGPGPSTNDKEEEGSNA